MYFQPSDRTWTIRMEEAKPKSASSHGENDMWPTVRTVIVSVARNSQREAAAHNENISQPMSLRVPGLNPCIRSDSKAPRYQRIRWAQSVRTVGIRSVCALHARGAIVTYPLTRS